MLKFQIPLDSHYLHASNVFLMRNNKVIPLKALRRECSATGTEGEYISFELEENELKDALYVLGVSKERSGDQEN